MGRDDWDEDSPQDAGGAGELRDDGSPQDDDLFDEDEVFDDDELGLEDLTEEDVDWDDDLDDLDTDGHWREGAGDDDWN